MAGGVHPEHPEFGAEPLGVAEVGQPGRRGPVAAGQRQLGTAGTPGPARSPVQFRQVQLQVTPVGAERVEPADLGEPLREW